LLIDRDYKIHIPHNRIHIWRMDWLNPILKSRRGESGSDVQLWWTETLFCKVEYERKHSMTAGQAHSLAWQLWWKRGLCYRGWFIKEDSVVWWVWLSGYRERQVSSKWSL